MATLRNLIAGFQIIAKYTGEDTHIGGADHDIIYVAPSEVSVSPEDAKTLQDLGFIGDDGDADGWTIFV